MFQNCVLSYCVFSFISSAEKLAICCNLTDLSKNFKRRESFEREVKLISVSQNMVVIFKIWFFCDKLALNKSGILL